MATVLVTRPAGAADPIVIEVLERGHRVHAVPTVTTEPVTGGPEGAALDVALTTLATFDWLVVTSPTGARAIAGRLGALGLTAPAPGGRPRRAAVCRPRWAAVGRSTAAALEAGGIRAEVVPAEARGWESAGAIAAVEPLAVRRILLARASAADGELPAELWARGATVVEVVVYRTMEGPVGSAGPLSRALDDPDLALIIFASGSAARGLLALADARRSERARRLPVVSIGPSTSAVARRLAFAVAAEADHPTVEGLTSAVEGFLSGLADGLGRGVDGRGLVVGRLPGGVESLELGQSIESVSIAALEPARAP